MRKNVKILSVIFIMAISLVQIIKTNACTRVIYKNADGTIMFTARSMDWNVDLETKLWYFPANMKHTGIVDPSNYSWISKYSSVIASALDMCSTDGINEHGLVANVLWLKESQFPKINHSAGELPGMPVSVLVQYVLDMYKTVDEIVADSLGKNKFKIFTIPLPYDSTKIVALHLSVSDKTGNSAIIEFINGKIVIYKNPEYQVMTNSPTFDLLIPVYYKWKHEDSADNLPGSNISKDRFARAAYYTNNIKIKNEDALAGVFSIIRDCSVPIGVQDSINPNIATTLWRTVSDSKNGIYYFESAYKQNILSIDLNKIKSLNIDKCGVYDPYTAKFIQNDITKRLFEKTVKPFDFAGY